MTRKIIVLEENVKQRLDGENGKSFLNDEENCMFVVSVNH